MDQLIEQGVSSGGARPGRPGPRFFYGWVMLPMAILLMLATSPGQTFGLAAFNVSFRGTLGLSHTALTGAYMVGTLLAALPLTWVGRVMDRHGLRRTATVVVVLFGLACCCAALANGLVALLLAFFLLRMLGPGALSLLSSTTLAYWFDRRLGALEGVRQMGMALAVAVVPGMNLWLIERFGWRTAFLVLGLGVCAVLLPLLGLVYRSRPEDVGQVRDGSAPEGEAARHAGGPWGAEGPEVPLAAAVRSRAFWVVLYIGGLWSLIATAVVFNIVPLCQAQGLGEQHAAGLLSTLAVSLALTNLVAGVLADYLPPRLLLAIATAFMMGLCCGLSRLALPGVFVACGVMMGLAQGLSTGLISVICVRYFGRLHLGQIKGLFATAQIASSSLGPFLVGLTRDLTGSYQTVLSLFALLALGGCVAATFATEPVAQREGDPGGCEGVQAAAPVVVPENTTA